MGEVKDIEINIVGMFSDSKEVKEIMNIAKVFVIEERMIDIADEVEIDKAINKKISKLPKKLKQSRHIDHRFTFLTVRGLN